MEIKVFFFTLRTISLATFLGPGRKSSNSIVCRHSVRRLITGSLASKFHTAGV